MAHTHNQNPEGACGQAFLISMLAAALCILPLAGLLAPRLLGFAPAIIGILSLPVLRIAVGSWPAFNKAYLTIVAVTVSFAALSSFWAIDSSFALERSVKIALVFVGGAGLFAALRAPQLSWPCWFSLAFPLSVLLAIGLIITELITHGLLHNTLRGQEAAMNNENVSMLNRAVVFLTLLSLPALAILPDDHGPRFKNAARALFLLLMMSMLALTDSQSAQLAIIVAALFGFAFPYRRPKAWIALGALLITGILSGPWVVQFLYETLASQVKNMPWLSSAYAADRLEIWDFIARKALENPLFGFGIEATRHIDRFDTPMLYTPVDHVLHPHNAVLQIWIEFGLIGALGLCGFVAWVLRSLYKFTKESEDLLPARVYLSVFMAVFTVSCTAYGFWQGWWLGLLTLLAALCALIANLKTSK